LLLVIPKGDLLLSWPPKINPKKLQNFHPANTVLPQTVFATQFTTICPQINHPQTPKNSKTPAKITFSSPNFFRQQKPEI